LERPLSLAQQPLTKSTTAEGAAATGFAGSRATPLALPEPLSTIAVVACYVGLEWLSFLHEHDELPVTPWSPGLGVMFAAIILKGPYYGVVLFAGVLLSYLLVLHSDLPWLGILANCAVFACSYTLVAMIARRRLQLDARLSHMRDILVLMLAGLAGAVIASLLLGVSLVSIRHFDMSDIAHTAAPLIVGDVIGIAVVTPLVLRLTLHREHMLSETRLGAVAEIAAFLAAILLSVWLVLSPLSSFGQSAFYLLFLPVVIAAVRHGLDGACAALAVVQLGLVTFLHVYGFDLSRFTEYQALMLFLTLTGLLVGVLVSERHAADAAAHLARERLHELQAEAARVARLNLASGMASALAHEINQPMTAARALARSAEQLLGSPEGDRDRARKNVVTMIEQIDHAAGVVRRMREFLRRGEPHVSTLDIDKVLADAVVVLRPLVAARRIALSVSAPQSGPAVLGDSVQLQQVIINLVWNAAEAISETGRRDGRIDLWARLSASGEEFAFGVRDNGAGVAAEQVATLFEPLSTSRLEGVGLGLSISKSIVEAHGGRIWLSANEPGRTEFQFTLPVAARQASRE
jgi:signal transduction histidine kinase